MAATGWPLGDSSACDPGPVSYTHLNDTLIGGAGADVLDGGTGIDLVDFSGSSAGVGVNLTTGTGTGGDATGDTYTAIELSLIHI